jgi:hypothetical protein
MPTSSLISFPLDLATNTLNYSGALINDLKPFIVIVVGILILGLIIDAVRGVE